jgi:hypothetical protein
VAGVSLGGGGWPREEGLSLVEGAGPRAEGAGPRVAGLPLVRRGLSPCGEAVPRWRGSAPGGGGCPSCEEVVPCAEGLSLVPGRLSLRFFFGCFFRFFSRQGP